MRDALRLERTFVIVAFATIAARFVVAFSLDDHLDWILAGDIYGFAELGNAHGRPYVDYDVAYPPLTLLFFKAVALWAGSIIEFARSLIWLNVLFDVAIAAVLLWCWGRVAAAFYLVSGVTLVPLLYLRVDLLSTLAAVLGLALLRRGRERAAGATIALATFVKLWPGWLLLVGCTRWSEGSRRFAGSALAITAVLGGAWVALGGIDGVEQVVTYGGAEGWEIETIPGVVLMLRDPSAWFAEEGAVRIGDVATVARVLMPVASLSIVAWASIRSSSVERYGAGWITSVTALLVFAALLSAQFVLWLLPGAAIAWMERDRVLAVVAALCTPVTALEVWHWTDILEGERAWLWVLMLRNVLLVLALLLGMRTLLRPTRPAAACDPQSVRTERQPA